MKDAWLRARAEVENVRRQGQADVARAHKYAIEKFAEDLLAVKDALEQTLAADASVSAETLKAGADLTLKALNAAFGARADPGNRPGRAEIRSASASGDAGRRQRPAAQHRRHGLPEGLPAQRPRAAPGAGHRFEGAGVARRRRAGGLIQNIDNPISTSRRTHSGARRQIKMSKIIGIDLGTTNSCVAIMEGGTAQGDRELGRRAHDAVGRRVRGRRRNPRRRAGQAAGGHQRRRTRSSRSSA